MFQPAYSLERAKTETWTSHALGAIDYHLLLLLALPSLLLRLDDSWLFSYGMTNFIDPWVYFGYFLDLRQHLQSFAGTYYGSRLPWILPGFLTYRTFSPLVAACVLHLAFYYSAVISLYLILKHTVDQRSALLAAILFGSHSFFLRAIGWDYVDGAGITYFLLTLLMLTYAAESRHFYAWLGFAGLFYGCLVYTQLFLVSFTPLIALYYFYCNRQRGPHTLVLGTAFFAVGFAILTVVLSMVNYHVSGQFLFFLPSVRFAGGIVTGGNRWRASTYAWLAQAVWLLVPALTLLGSLILLVCRRMTDTVSGQGFLLFFQLYFLLNVLTLVSWELGRQPVLNYSYYSSYLLPASFLAIGAQLAGVVKGLSLYRFYVVLAGVVLISLFPLFLHADSRLIVEVRSHLFLLFLVGVPGLVSLASRRHYHGSGAVLLISAAVAVVNLGASTRAWNPFPQDHAFPRNSFLVVAECVRTIQGMDPRADSLFWYNFHTPLGGIHRSVASAYLWGWRLVSEEFPALDGAYQQPSLHTRIFILSNETDVVDEANKSLKQMGLKAHFIKERIIQQGSISYKITFVELRALNEGSNQVIRRNR